MDGCQIFIPFLASHPRLTEQAIHALGVSTGSDRQQLTQRYVHFRVALVAARVATPQASELLAGRRRFRPLAERFLAELNLVPTFTAAPAAGVPLLTAGRPRPAGRTFCGRLSVHWGALRLPSVCPRCERR